MRLRCGGFDRMVVRLERLLVGFCLLGRGRRRLRRGLIGCFPFGEDQRDFVAHFDDGSLIDVELGDGAVLERLHFHGRLVGLHLGQNLPDFNLVTFGLAPLGEGALDHGVAEFGHREDWHRRK